MKHLSKVETPDGQAIVFTKIRYFFFFSKPRTSVMPFGADDFLHQPGCQVWYNTSDPSKLRELHEALVFMACSAGWKVLSRIARLGFVPYPPDKSYLQQWVKRVV